MYSISLFTNSDSKLSLQTVSRDVVLDNWQTYRTNWKPYEYMSRDDVYVNSTWLYSFLVVSIEGWYYSTASLGL